MHFLHEGLPPMQLRAHVADPNAAAKSGTKPFGAWLAVESQSESLELKGMLPAVLALPNVRTRKPLVQQYDHEVQARSVRKPYGTPGHKAPNDGATLRLSRKTFEGVALGIGLAPAVAAIDPKVAAELALDEALRNAAVAGMDPAHAALVDNFCWPDPLPSAHNPDAEEKLGALVVTCKRIFDGAVALQMPFVSGKDSMKNDYRVGNVKISVPPTLLITTMGKVHDVRRVPCGYATAAGQSVLWVSGQEHRWDALGLPHIDFDRARRFYIAFHSLIREGAITSAHDVSDGGWLVAMSEMLFGTGLGAELKLGGEDEWTGLFAEPATSFVLLVDPEKRDRVQSALSDFNVTEVGHTKRVAGPGGAILGVEWQGKRTEWLVEDLERAYES
jgi:phosphoribosylformylglycinamidine synthase